MNVQQLPTPSNTTSSRSRRTINISDETEASASSTVSIVGEGRRFGWPVLDELPLGILHNRHRFEDLPRHEIQFLVEREARALDLEIHDIDFVFRYDALTGEPSDHRTLLIMATYEESSNGFYILVNRVRELLLRMSVSNLRVEIIDPILQKFRRITTLEGSHRAVQEWPTLRHEILHRLGKNDWSFLSLVRHEALDSTDMLPTVLIEAQHPYLIAGFVNEMSELLLQQGFNDLTVEINRIANPVAKGHGCRRALSTPSSALEYDEFVNDTHMGSSIGVDHSLKSTGTFGGFMVLQKGQVQKKVGLTNWHVMCAEEVDKGEQFLSSRIQVSRLLIYVDFDQKGLQPGGSDRYPTILISSPSRQDYDSTLNTNTTYLEGLREPLSKIYSKYGIDPDEPDPELVDMMDKRDKDGIQEWTNFIQDGLKVKRHVEGLNRSLGKLWAGSGRRVNPGDNIWLDWALVDLRQRQIFNEVILQYFVYYIVISI